MSLPASRTLYISPGAVCLPSSAARLCTVVASGVAVTVFDRIRSCGGLGHYVHPFRTGGRSSSEFAAPSIVSLIGMFTEAGSDLRHLEIFVYGGSDNPSAPGYGGERGRINLRVGLEILARLGLRPSGTDTGGRFARRLVFYTETGECMLAKVTDAPDHAWYPAPGLRRCAGTL